jgi:hypothetical protein
MCSAARAEASELPPGATVLDPDIVWDVANPHSFVISPDGKQIAYISKGALWACDVDAGPPTKLAELPNTTTAILADPANQERRDKSAASPHDTGFYPFYGPKYSDRDHVFSVAWSADQSGVVYTVRKRIRDHSAVAAYHVMHASLNGTVDEIAIVEGEFGAQQEDQTMFHLTPDRTFVVVSSYTPLIWDVRTSRPRVTPYDLLQPSATSGRYLGIEIDTRELVLVDEQFRIAKRFGITFPDQRRVDLTWSKEERFAVCRTRNIQPSFTATAFRVDLETGQQTPPMDCHTRDQFVFADGESELLHLRTHTLLFPGRVSGDPATRVALLDKDGVKQDVFSSRGSRHAQSGQQGVQFAPMVATPDGSYVAIAVPRPPDQLPGAHYHLLDREGRAKPFIPQTDAHYITPYYPITFAEGGRRLISRSGSTLFSLPVSAVAQDVEPTDVE